MSAITMNEWLAELDRLRVEDKPADAPAHAITQADYMQRYNVNRSTARDQLDRLVRDGKLQQGWKWTTDDRGHSIRAKAYWPKREAA